MRVLVAGASGVIGRPSVRELLAAGHEVVGLARSDVAATIVRDLGAEVAHGDLLDGDAVLAAAQGAEAVVNLTGALPAGKGAVWDQSSAVWQQGTKNLLAAARAANVQVYVQASLALLYGPHGDAWVTEETELSSGSLVAAALRAEEAVTQAGNDGLPVVVLRLGTVYGRDAWHTRMLAAQARARALTIVGDGQAFWSLLHAEDAGRAIALAVDDAEAGAVYNVADDLPMRMADLLGVIAQLAGAPPPSRVPEMLARVAVGADVVTLLTTSIRLSNRAIKQDLELSLRYPTPEEGLREVLSQPVPDPD